MNPDFREFPKMARLSRECIITEKIDGTNAQIFITDSGDIMAGSRSRWISQKDDNFGFAAWVEGNKNELLKLGPGRHFGEWWGQGIQRNYGLKERRFSLFNTIRWCCFGGIPQPISSQNPKEIKLQDILPECCSLVPVLYRGIFTTSACEQAIAELDKYGSKASSGFMNPEGIVCFHVAANIGFKKTIKNDETPKTLQ